jgi:hypothetical protein
MSLNLSTLSITNSIINLENQINELNPQLTTLQDNINLKQNIINDGDLTISKIDTLQNVLNNKQATITTATVLPGFSISNSGTLKFPSNGSASGKIQFFKSNNILLSKKLDYTEIENLETDIASKQPIITASTNLPGFNINSGSNFIFLLSGTTSGNINFFNPTNQLDVKQMNFNELVSIEDSIDTLTTTKQDILTAGDNITIVDNVISSSGNIIYPVLSVCRSTDFIINSSSNDTYMPFDVVVVDNYNGFNTSNGQYTIPIDGVYYIGASVSSMNSTTRKLYVDILKGGVSICLMLSQNLVTGDNFYHNTGVI